MMLQGGLGHNLLMHFSSLCSSKLEIPEPVFFCILTIQNDQTFYVKHVLDPLYVFSPYLGVVVFLQGGGEGPKGAGAQLAYAVFQPLQLKNGNI